MSLAARSDQSLMLFVSAEVTKTVISHHTMVDGLNKVVVKGFH